MVNTSCLVEVESCRKRLISLTQTVKQEMAQCLRQCHFSSRCLFCLLLFFSSFRLILSAFGWEQVEYHTKLMDKGLCIQYWLYGLCMFVCLFSDCNAQVHKGCRESLPVCAKVKMKVFHCLLSWFSYDCHKRWNLCTFNMYLLLTIVSFITNIVEITWVMGKFTAA